MSRKQDKNELADTLTTYVNTGFSLENQGMILKGLVAKGYIMILPENKYKITDKWYDAFPNIEKEFNQYFWIEIDEHGNARSAWTGTKKKALEYYIKLRKKYSRDYLSTQRANYFEYLKLENQRGFARQRMMAQVFLNPGNERFAEDYADYTEQLRIKLGIKPATQTNNPITIDKVREAYGKNNNQ
jgi:hypothetical protein